MNKKNIIIVSTLIIMIFLSYYFGLHEKFNIDVIIENNKLLSEYIKNNFIFSSFIFVLAYTISTAINIPVATVFTLGAGLLFGSFYGTFLSSISSVTGATIAFLISRFVLKDYFANKYKDQFNNINSQIEKDGISIIFMLRMIPIFPFFLVNILIGLTTIKTFTYVWISALGMLPATFIYVNFGAQLNPSKIENGVKISNILDINMILSLTLIGLLPFISKKLMAIIKKVKKNV